MRGKRPKVLIAGIGNELRGDDGLGPAIVNELSKRPLPSNVDVADFGERLYELLLRLKGYDMVMIVDALDLDGSPGQVYMIEFGIVNYGKDLMALNLHESDLKNILALGRKLGIMPDKVYIIGCQPKDISYKIGLSDVVKNKLGEIINAIEKILRDHV